MCVYVKGQSVPLTSFLMSVDDDLFAMMIQSTQFRTVQDFADRYISIYESIYDCDFSCI